MTSSQKNYQQPPCLFATHQDPFFLRSVVLLFKGACITYQGPMMAQYGSTKHPTNLNYNRPPKTFMCLRQNQGPNQNSFGEGKRTISKFLLIPMDCYELGPYDRNLKSPGLYLFFSLFIFEIKFHLPLAGAHVLDLSAGTGLVGLLAHRLALGGGVKRRLVCW